MTNTLLNISGKLDPATTELYVTLNSVTDELSIPYIVVGASARDMVLHHGYGTDIRRATTDIDLGIQVSEWEAFQALKQSLLARGFVVTRSPHRLISPYDMPIDIVPFGGIEDTEARIAWPPEGDVVMNMLGFKEAFEHAQIVRLRDQLPRVDIRVATPAGMVLLKLIAWTDRAREKRDKDAQDFRYLLKTYENIPAVKEVLYDENNQAIMEMYDWDVELAGACCLGQDALDIASAETRTVINKLFTEGFEGLSKECLIEEMSRQIEAYERNTELLNAFIYGFTRYK